MPSRGGAWCPHWKLREVLGGYLPPGEYGTPLGVVFTDDWNPVEYLAAQTLKKHRPDGK